MSSAGDSPFFREGQFWIGFRLSVWRETSYNMFEMLFILFFFFLSIGITTIHDK